MVACPAFVLCLALGPFAADSPQGDPAEAPRALAQQILEQGKYQHSPPAQLAGDPNLPDESDDERDPRRAREPAIRGGGSHGFLTAPIVIPLVVGAVLVVLLLLGLTRQGGLAAERRQAQAAATAVAAGAAAIAAGEREEDPDRLAAEGRFAEAVHVLLLRALRRLARSVGGLAQGLTSREILPRAPDGAPRSALQELVAAVELHEFGAHELTARDFERCRAAAAALPNEPDVIRAKSRA